MSGVEIAGLVLGAVPLLISACEHYVEGIDTMKKWWRFEREISNTKRTLIAEQVVLQGTCERLLDGLVSASKLEHLLENAGSEEWKDKDLEKKLKHRLGKAYASFLACLLEMERLVGALSEMLEVSSKAEVRFFMGSDWMSLVSHETYRQHLVLVKISTSSSRGSKSPSRRKSVR